MLKLAKNKKYQKVKFFSINMEFNEIWSFYHDKPPVLLLYSKWDFLSPKVYEDEADI